MNDISYEQYRFLTIAKKYSGDKTIAFADSHKDICDFLIQHGYITRISSHHSDVIDGYRVRRSTVTGYRITQEGEVARYVFFSKFLKWWIPLIISIAALIAPVLYR